MKKIILFCTAGMSTSMLVKKMQAAADEIEYDCSVEAHSISEVLKVGQDADMILLGPQIKFNKKDVESKCPGIPVEVINMRDYGTMNGKNVINHVIEVLKNKEEEK